MIKVITMAMIAALMLNPNKQDTIKFESRTTKVTKPPDDKLYNTAALFIKSEESLKLKPYKSQGGKWTIGWGHTMTRSEHRMYRNGISLKKANKLFDNDYAKSIKEVKRNFPKLKSHKKIILTSMIAFNIGMRFTTKRLGKAIKDGCDIKPHLLRYINVNGRASKGLIRRRKAELGLWNASHGEFIAAADDYKDNVNKKIKQAY